MEITENVNMMGVIKIDNKIVAQATATVSSEVGAATTYSESINDYKKYVENKVTCREQFDAFKAKVRAKEDELQVTYHTPKVQEAPTGVGE